MTRRAFIRIARRVTPCSGVDFCGHCADERPLSFLKYFEFSFLGLGCFDFRLGAHGVSLGLFSIMRARDGDISTAWPVSNPGLIHTSISLARDSLIAALRAFRPHSHTHTPTNFSFARHNCHMSLRPHFLSYSREEKQKTKQQSRNNQISNCYYSRNPTTIYLHVFFPFSVNDESFSQLWRHEVPGEAIKIGGVRDLSARMHGRGRGDHQRGVFPFSMIGRDLIWMDEN